MRLHILSDLHLEFAPFVTPDAVPDAVILAGDIHTGRNGLKWALQTFPDHPVIYVLGNHEFYGQKLQKLVVELREMASGTNLRVTRADMTRADMTRAEACQHRCEHPKYAGVSVYHYEKKYSGNSSLCDRGLR